MSARCVVGSRRCAQSFSRLLSFFFNDTAPTEIYTLSLHDALPISIILFLQLPAPAPRQHAADRLLILWDRLNARRIFALIDQAADMSGDLFERREPDIALGDDLLEEFGEDMPARQPAGGKGMNDRNPQTAIGIGSFELVFVELDALTCRAHWHHVVEIEGSHPLRPVIEAPMRRHFDQCAPVDP